ncbi:S8 family serine peptidase [Methylocella tundrae]|uniref:S8 family serine peptidase n=1 Tax=Methylocella tundrae TaxID=227605 RepID=UPI00157ACA85|nr:S8 family serine peptidase [Methylocella tundrae]
MRLSARMGLSATEVAFATEPLFQSVGVTRGRGAAASSGVWRLATASATLDGDGWDQCHDIVAQNAGVMLVEPDVEQQWTYPHRAAANRGRGMRSGASQPQDIGDGYAGDKNNNYWFRDSRHGQFDAAGAAGGSGQGVRIAHLDTGYDPGHKSTPKGLNPRLARNFVDADRPNDATDRSDGLFNNFSHGCGTLGILAGAAVPGLKPFGCAPNAEIVPVRVANSVVLFSNSSIARGLDYVHTLCASEATRVHVVSMSMGGLPSDAWADAINALYEAGVVVVTAAGNNYSNAPTRFVVYPARFGRVIAACGVMADGHPYANLPPKRMAGNYGPQSKTLTAIAAYTPNVPWARFGVPTIVDFDGNGTSSATPQVAGAAALWIEKHRAQFDAYPQGWLRVEAVRKALFDSAAKGAAADAEELGYGMLRAADALSRQAAPASRLARSAPDNANFALLKLLLGDASPGFAAAAGTNMAMLELETAQVAAKSGLETLTETWTPTTRRRLIEEMLARPDLSKPLRAALEKASADGGVIAPLPRPGTQTAKPAPTPADLEMERHFLKLALDPRPPEPPYRRLRIYAYDPGQQTDPSMFDVSVAAVTTRWEANLKPGPVGEYLEVVDVDPASNACYAPVDLNDPRVLAESGLAPSESNPQFHQQMAYAVAMRTIERFERALGRKALWARRRPRKAGEIVADNGFVQRLRIYPHALREANAYYDPDKIALLFGYFQAADSAGSVTRGAGIFGVVSHDIVAHETTHALLDGLHPRFSERTNLDMAAFHEAFADIVALFQHFSMPESLTRQISRAQGSTPEIGRSLGRLAQQFGEATGMHGALRRFVGETGSSVPVLSDDMTEPHDRGAVLVSAVFAAFLTIYASRCADLIRLATNGSGILPGGAIPVDLANRLASEASKTADHVLNMCIRALDYCPPVNLEFGDYLRAIITADRDLVRDDDRGYRVAFIDAFRQRGILSSGVSHLAEDSLLWEPPAMETEMLDLFSKILPLLDLSWGLTIDRKSAFFHSQENGRKLNNWLTDPSDPKRRLLRQILGFEEPAKSWTGVIGGQSFAGEIRPIEAHSVRVCRRSAPDGSSTSTLVIELTQTFRAEPNGDRYRGGCTLLFDLNVNGLKYLVRKKLFSSWSVQNQASAQQAAMTSAAENGQVYYPPGDPAGRGKTFAIMHRCGRTP